MGLNRNWAHHLAGLLLGPALFLFSASGSAIAQVPADSAALADSAKLLSEQAEGAYGQGTRETLERALDLWAQVSELYRRLGDRRGEGNTLRSIGSVHYGVGRPDSALVYFRQSLAIMREVGDRGGEGRALGNIGIVHYQLGRADSALIYYRQALAIKREVGDRRGEGSTVNNMGLVHYGLGRPDSALVYYRQSLAINRELGNRRGEGSSTTGLAVPTRRSRTSGGR